MPETTLNRVISLQQQGYSDEQIVSLLTDEGVSPKEITDAINKSKIKAAIYQPEYYPGPYPAIATPSTQVSAPLAPSPTPTVPASEATSYYPEYIQGMSTETITEIAEQLISQKLTNITKTISELSISKERMEKQVSLLDERLRKIEEIIDELKLSIIKKIGEYGTNTEEIKKEMSMMQDSFSKVMTPLAENVKKLEDMLSKEPTRISFKKQEKSAA